MSRRTLTNNLVTKSNQLKAELRATFLKTNYICLTADIWSTQRKSFMGITAHWLDEHSFKRHSVALACRRFTGMHSYDKIAELIVCIMDEYNIDILKAVAIVTDNGSNFVKAFKEFQITLNLNAEEYDSESDKENENTSVSHETTDFLEVCLSSTSNASISLPYHIRCAAHTLSLIATTDCAKALQDKKFSSANHQTMGKLQALWNACSKPKTGEQIVNVLGCCLKKPCVTRWNSLYDCIDQILSIDEEKLEAIFHIINVFKPNSYESL